ncbi:MAG: 5-(carboxyamino)imidazole ribonucleotide synthase [Bacteroidia bacterium]|nr:5-(carboxyamino)imidazole ribonucleotide synthase [Bacteroidia bacterium]
MNNINPLRKTIGIIGGGQLGRMMIEESLRLNNEFSVLDAKDCPCASLAQNHVVGKLTDGNAIRQLAKVSDVLTFEIEHLDIDTLLELEKEGKEIIPSPKVLQIIKDKGLQKQFLTTNKIPTAPFELVETEAEWLKAIQKLGGEKLVAKTRTDGYDGKGVTIFNANEVLNNTDKIPFNTPSLIEAFIPCQKEISVMVAQDKFGNSITWPIVEMDFDPQANLVTYLYCPATLDPTVEKSAKEIAIQTIENLNGVGVFAVEMFLTNENQILVNEIAPRPHNSGHHTIEACYTSQFEQLVRILIGLPLGSTQLIKPAIMINLLGASDFSGAYKLDGLEDVSTLEGVYVHLYGKKESKPMRKMGHVTILANTPEEAKLKAKHVYETLRFIKDV